MVNIRCGDYGYECNYVSQGNVEKIVFDFWEHMNNEHGIDYSKETIAESIKRKNPENFSNHLKMRISK